MSRPALQHRLRALPGRALQSLRQGWRQHLITLLLAALVVAGVDAWRTRDLPKGPAPDAAITLADGSDTTRAQWRALHPGKAVALHFWADWCPVCKIEEPSVAKLSADWPVLGIAMQSGPPARVAQVQRQRGMPWPTAVDPQATLSREWGVKAVPALVVVDAQGHVRFATVGYTPGWGMRWRLWWAQVVPRWSALAG